MSLSRLCFRLIEVEAGKDKDPDRQLSIKVVYKERGHTRVCCPSMLKTTSFFTINSGVVFKGPPQRGGGAGQMQTPADRGRG